MCIHTSFNSIDDREADTLKRIYSAIESNDTNEIINLTTNLIDEDPYNSNNIILENYINSLK